MSMKCFAIAALIAALVGSSSNQNETSAHTAQTQLRSGQSAILVYHEALEQMILINGGALAGKSGSDPIELWVWDGQSWSAIASDPSGPRWRNFGAAIYDSEADVVVLQGGYQFNQSTEDGDTWEWNGQSWTRFSSQSPGPREGGKMAFDEARHEIVYFGGALNFEIFGDTWIRKEDQWQPLDVTGPSRRFPAGAVYDRAREQVLLYAGHFADNNRGENYGDLWAWDGASWRELDQGDVTPGIRASAALAYDSKRQLVLMSSGGATTFYNDLWAWDGQKWQLLSDEGGPFVSGHTMAYDAKRDVVVVFGGVTRPGGPPTSATWEWDGQSWTCLYACD